MQIALNGITTMPYPILTDVRIARSAGYDGLIVVGDKLRRHLDVGYSLDQTRTELAGVPVLGLGNVRDIERASDAGRTALFAECEELCRMAQALDCPNVQILTGPLDPSGGYVEPLSMSAADIHRSAVTNLTEIAAIGSRFGVGFYLEALAWTPLNSLDEIVGIIEEVGASNIGIAIDFWHLWNSGAGPSDVARLDSSMIRCVDFCDGIGPAGRVVDPGQRGRDIWTGAGSIPLQLWVDAVRATGFDGVWSCEVLSPKHWELDPFRTAEDSRRFLEYLFL